MATKYFFEQKSLARGGPRFPVPEDCSSSFLWEEKWYTMRMGDAAFLDKVYARKPGADKRGPTHAEKLALIAELGWETRLIGRMYHVVPQGD